MTPRIARVRSYWSVQPREICELLGILFSEYTLQTFATLISSVFNGFIVQIAILLRKYWIILSCSTLENRLIFTIYSNCGLMCLFLQGLFSMLCLINNRIAKITVTKENVISNIYYDVNEGSGRIQEWRNQDNMTQQYKKKMLKNVWDNNLQETDQEIQRLYILRLKDFLHFKSTTSQNRYGASSKSIRNNYIPIKNNQTRYNNKTSNNQTYLLRTYLVIIDMFIKIATCVFRVKSVNPRPAKNHPGTSVQSSKRRVTCRGVRWTRKFY